MNKPATVTDWGLLLPGKKYEVVWKQQSGNYRWYKKAAVWTFIDISKPSGQLIWSGRPVCGTQDMDVENFIEAVQTSQEARCTVPKSLGPL